jgi:hypothetical protein
MNDQVQLTSGTLSGTDATDTAYIVNRYSSTLQIETVDIEPKTTVATHASNYITTSVKKGSDTIASHTTNSSGGSALTAATLKSLTLTGTGQVLEIAPGGVISMDVAKAGTGPAYNHRVVVRGRLIR